MVDDDKDVCQEARRTNASIEAAVMLAAIPDRDQPTDENNTNSSDPLNKDTTNQAAISSSSPAMGDSETKDEASSSDDHNASPDAVVLSKKQRKRLLKREKMLDKKRQKKQERHAQAIAAGRDLEAEQRLLAERTAMGHRKQRLEQLWTTVKRPLAEQCFQICVDCSFESLMNPRELASLAQQIRYCYSYNKRASNPCLVAITGVGDMTLSLLQKEAGFPEWKNRLFTCTDKSLEDYYYNHPAAATEDDDERSNNKNKIVYLTSDAETTLDKLEDDKIYVIGGIVDRNRLKRVAIDRANALGVATARLPLDEYLAQMESTKVLTCNHVFDILLKCRQYGNDWTKAFQDVLPSRKDAKFKESLEEKDLTQGQAAEGRK